MIVTPRVRTISYEWSIKIATSSHITPCLCCISLPFSILVYTPHCLRPCSCMRCVWNKSTVWISWHITSLGEASEMKRVATLIQINAVDIENNFKQCVRRSCMTSLTSSFPSSLTSTLKDFLEETQSQPIKVTVQSTSRGLKVIKHDDVLFKMI